MTAVQVDVFCEDVGHESVARALLARIGRELGVRVAASFPCARGGAGRVLAELKSWQQLRRRDAAFAPDILVVLVDADGEEPQSKARDIEARLDGALFPAVVVACPDPHVERWLFADPVAFAAVLGADPPTDPNCREPGTYKALLADAVARAGAITLTSPMEDFAPDIVAALDLYRAGRARPELGHFIDALRAALRRASG